MGLPPNNLRSSRHLPALDGVRGIAILLVLLFHFGLYGHGLPPPSVFVDRAFYAVAGIGWAGVDLFFVLSGFLITGILYDARSGSRYFRNFYARRCLRILPLYYGALIVFTVCLPLLLPQDEGLRHATATAAWHWTFLTNVLVALEGWHPNGMLDHFWSLAVEEQFYLVWPVLVFVFGRVALLRVCWIVIAGALLVRIGLWTAGYEIAPSVLGPARADALAVGALLALVARGPDGLSRVAAFARPAAGLLGAALAFVFWGVVLPQRDPVVATGGYSLLAAFFGAVLVIALTASPAGVPGRWLASRPLTFFGRYSYGLYVIHVPLVFVAPAVVGPARVSDVPHLLGSQLPALLLYITAASLASVCLALVSWHALEKPFLQLKRWFPYDVRAGKGPATTAYAVPLSSGPAR